MRAKDLLGLRFALRHIRTRIRRGPCNGLQFSVATRGSFLNGSFEKTRIEALVSMLRPDDVLWDIGSHFGYVTLAASSRVKGVYAFEPSQSNLWYTRHHVKWNELENVKVLPYAISGYDGAATFGGPTSLTGKLDGGAQAVQVRSVDSLVQSGECDAPTWLKIDVEGAEHQVLQGGVAAIAKSAQVLLVATHTPELHLQCAATLSGWGFRIYEAERNRQAFEHGWSSVPIEPEILAVRPGHELSADAVAAFERS